MYLITPANTGWSRDEIAGLRRALDRVYVRIRERARAEWEARYAGSDPSDLCVSIRIGRSNRDVAAH